MGLRVEKEHHRDSVLYLGKDASIALNRRSFTSGPELQMVFDFLDPSIFRKPLNIRSKNIAVFLEPWIDSGYPDLVIASYDPSAFSSWSAERNDLSDNDLRVLGLAVRHRSVTYESIQRILGFSRAEATASLDLLTVSGVLFENARSWRTMPRDSFFGLKRLIAIEAKMGDANGAMRQAMYNNRFASESYIMIPSSKATASALQRGIEWGIGIIAGSGEKMVLPASRAKIPINHISLKFNEWIGRKLNSGAI